MTSDSRAVLEERAPVDAGQSAERGHKLALIRALEVNDPENWHDPLVPSEESSPANGKLITPCSTTGLTSRAA